MPEIAWKFGPTCNAYIHSTAQINALFGPPGSNKTFASISAFFAHQRRCGQSIRIAIIRDTLENIRISVVPSILEYCAASPGMVQFKNEYKEMRINIHGGFHIDADLFGCNDPADLQRLQGASTWSLIWINDPAPMTEKGNAGVPEVVYEHAAYRSTRKSESASRLQIDMNYAEETHWTYRRLILEPDIDPDSPMIVKAVWHVPYSECFGYNEEAIQMASRVFKDEASRARYVEGRFAEFKPGKDVAPGYKREIHLCPNELYPGPLESFAFCDGWFNPTVILGQITTARRLIYIDTVRAEGADIATLLETQVGPLLRSPKWTDPKTGQGKWRSWRIGGDRTMATPDQGNINHRASQDVEAFFKKFSDGLSPTFEGGPVKWSELSNSFNHWLLQRDPDNQPMIYISRTNHLLDKALNGGWHYKVDNSGNIVGTEPVKNELSHIGDGWANSVYVLLGKKEIQINKGKLKQQAIKLRKRAEGYGAGRQVSRGFV